MSKKGVKAFWDCKEAEERRLQKTSIQELLDHIRNVEEQYRDKVGVDLFSGKGSFNLCQERSAKSVEVDLGVLYEDRWALIPEVKVGNEQMKTPEGSETVGKFSDEIVESLRQNFSRIEEAYRAIGEEAAEQPPKAAEYLARLLLPKANREALLGDLVEEYPGVVARFGVRRAKFDFWVHVLFSIFLLFRNAVVKWGLVGWVVELIRRMSS